MSFSHSTNQKRTLSLSPEETNQSRVVGMFMDSSDLDRIEMHPHLGLSSNPKGTRVYRLVQKLKGKPGVRNPYAVAQAATGQSYATGKKL
jgi:hypothetical protein